MVQLIHMPSKEHDQHYSPSSSEPLNPSVLPPELAEFLKDKQFACLMHETNEGTVFIIKAPNREIESLRGRIPIHLRHELHMHPTAPVIRTVLRLYDQPEHPLALETFTNIEEADQRATFEALSGQNQVYLLFYDESLAHRLSKGVAHTQGQAAAEILSMADLIKQEIPQDDYDFDGAKAAVVEHTTL
ncbi:MAG: hypothetical protein EPO21_18485 [Chloroflexota bacterium]|nr:MAG: hypothetical protein EPO21_18485 [Chloroflexota bacterium]